jgi:hypothetical protein
MKETTSTSVCTEGETLLADLVGEDLLELMPDERLWKLFCFASEDGRETGLRQRIYTKLKPDGRLAMLTFAVHSPAPGQTVRSGILKVPDLSIEALDHIIEQIRVQTGASGDEYQEIDLSGVPSLPDQIRRLGQLQD